MGAGRGRHDALDADDIEVAQRVLSRQDVQKRIVDIVMGTVLLLVAVPLILVTAIGSAIALRAWPFFVQDRIGRGGQTLKFVKVRTLPPSTNAYADKYALADVDIPAFTRVLRKLHLDELPQLALVVTGHMSLVGPRPEMPGLHAELPRHFATLRSLVRPGCTGLWQVSEHCDGLIGEAPEFDSLYVQHHSTRFDLWIMWQTLLKVVRGGTTAVTMAGVPDWVRTRVAAPLPLPSQASTPTVVIDLTALSAPALQDLDA